MKLKLYITLFSIALLMSSCSSGKLPRKGSRSKTVVAYNKKYQNKNSIFHTKKVPSPNNTFGKELPYLVINNDTKSHSSGIFTSYNEKKALSFYKNTKVKGYGDNSKYWRWKTSISKNALYSNVAKKLPSVYARSPRTVMTFRSGEWHSLPISSVGTVKNIEVASRGESGVITHLLISTSTGKYLVAKEFNIRNLLATGNPLYGAHGGETYSKTPISSSVGMLPSAYMAFETNSSTINIYGGGFGHGVGMPQYTAFDLTTNHKKNYKFVLDRYYPNSKLTDMKNVANMNGVIKVGITSSRNLEHSAVKIKSSNSIKVSGNGIKTFTVPANTVISSSASNGKVILKINGKEKLKTSSEINLNSGGHYIQLIGVNKSHTTSPKYRGSINLKPSSESKSKLRIINNVHIEDYLKQVVPSEMPQFFGVEALKVQAVAARTYAMSDYLQGKYLKHGFHIKDTDESQVYNNQVENEDATNAIIATRGKILVHDGKPIDAKYFSTSSGFTAAANTVW